MRCRPLAHSFRQNGIRFAVFENAVSTPDTAKALAAGRRVISIFNSGNPWRQQRLKGHLRACTEIVFRSPPKWRRNRGFRRSCQKPAERMFRATNGGFHSCPSATEKGDRDVQSEPESRPAEPDPRTEAGPAAGRWAETRTTAAGSEPSGTETRPGPLTPSPVKSSRYFRMKVRQVDVRIDGRASPSGGAFPLRCRYRSWLCLA